MRISLAAITSLVLIAATPSVLVAADNPPSLLRNPFSRPPSEVLRDEPSVVERDDGSGPTLALKATMVGDASRLANVAGRILKPGDEIEGYELIAVFEEFAIFKKDGSAITVYVKPHPAEKDE